MFYPTIALIPAYEPTLLLAELARRLSVFGFTVVIVDDGSGAEYRTVFQRAGKYADVIYCHPNRG
jgi:glycosyltransferase involved in cell wall biosynthesis